MVFDVYNGARVDKSRSEPHFIVPRTRKAARDDRKRLSGELFGLTCAGCDLRKEGVTVDVTQESNPKQSWIINPEVRSQPPHCD
jgi:hypothetical protein